MHIEITESVLVDTIENARFSIVDLRAHGCKVTIDDFGTGYSSFSYLSRLPVDAIKIDQSFVAQLGPSGPGTSIVQTMLALAETLQLDVVAEGVERPEQLELLQQLKCGYGQGYLWSRPLSAKATHSWMIDHADVSGDAPPVSPSGAGSPGAPAEVIASAGYERSGERCAAGR